jgi:hypothetical protein
MTKLLEEAFAEASKLSVQEQDADIDDIHMKRRKISQRAAVRIPPALVGRVRTQSQVRAIYW